MASIVGMNIPKYSSQTRLAAGGTSSPVPEAFVEWPVLLRHWLLYAASLLGIPCSSWACESLYTSDNFLDYKSGEEQTRSAKEV